MIAPWSLSRNLEIGLNKQLEGGKDIGEVLSDRENRKLLVANAFDIRKLGVHYTGRRCQFGAVAVVSCQQPDEPRPRLLIRTGHNYSPYRGAPKSCAEMSIDQMVKRINERYTRYLGNVSAELLVVCGPSDPERVRKIVNSDKFKQCPPCHDCLSRLRENDAFQPDTQVLLVNDTGKTDFAMWEVEMLMDKIERPPAAIEEHAGRLALSGAVLLRA